MPVHRERLRQPVLDVEAHAIAFVDLDGRAGYAAVEPPAIHDATGDQFRADVLDSDVEHLDAVLEPPRHVGDIGADDRDDAGAKLVRRHRRRWVPRACRLLRLAAPDERAAHKRFARRRRPQWTPGRAETNVCWTACEPRTGNGRLNANGCAQIGARRVQMRRTVMWEDVRRALRPGGPCIAAAVGMGASGTIA